MNSPASGRPPVVSPEIRVALYHRLHWLWPVLAQPGVRTTLRWLGWGAFAGWLLFVALVLALRYVLLPGVADYRPQIEAAATQAIGLPVSIGRVEARWRGINPDLVLADVVVADRQGAPAFSLGQVESVLSWESLWRFRLTLDVLAFVRPILHVRREPDGRITVAGLGAEGESDPAFAEWVLAQKHIRIRDAMIVWEDGLRQAPPLVLEDLQFGLDNNGRQHRFGLSAAPPEALAARIDVRGEITGDIGEALEHLAGKVFVELNYADLAGWRAWVDYPAQLSQGRGALRVWGDLENGAGKLTADVALEELRVRMGKKLPELALNSMRGRLEGRYRTGEWALAGRKVELLTEQGIRVAPTDFQLEWRQNPQTATVNGNASVNFVDLGVLAELAAYLPLDAYTRELLKRHQPQGRIAELNARWGLAGERLTSYSLKAGFEQMGLLAAGYVPGAAGLTGRIDLTDKGGDLLLNSAGSKISLPAVFPEPDTLLDSLKAKASWKTTPRGVDVQLDKLEFASPELAGSARGNYRYTGEGPGEIDLTASVDRADARVVWRYMPHVVNAEARNWIRRSLLAGQGSEGRLVLKGNLYDFPFRDDKGGKFIVTAKVQGGKVDYVSGWPLIDNIDADLTFGVGMKIAARKGTILGAHLSDVSVAIPDFDVHDEMLLVKGLAQGPTSEFLRFLDRSPVGASIDRFTEGMKASGNGSLDLDLKVPLRRSLESEVRGEYRFVNNQIEPVSALPPITKVNGRLSITEKSVSAQDITGQIFGGPLKVLVKSGEGKVTVQAAGKADVVQVSQHFGVPLTEYLQGKAAWKVDIGIRNRNADFVVESDLVGVGSPLPAPVSKQAEAALPLRIERTAPESGREQYRITLGNLAQGLILRRQGAWERGVLAVGDAEPRLPEKGLAVRVNTPKFDADAWQPFLPAATAGGGADGSGLALSLLSLKTPELRLLGRDFSQVETSLRPRADGWQIALTTREAIGDLYWRSAGEGWLEGNLKRLVVRPARETSEGTGSPINSLPGLSLMVADFYVGDKALGKLELKARNDKGAWNLDTLNLQNPDGALKGKAVWNNVGRNLSSLDFELTATDIGKLLGRLGYVDAVRRGQARLTGDLQWNGTLTGVHYPSLTGQMTVHAEKGQFNKLEPGVGKLLGLISLQSLPRRLTLDFRDIFSDGLAFDSIESKLQIKKGVMSTSEPLRIYGPAAEIEMQGSTNLRNETQDLQVVVRPEVGTAAVVGVAVVNPVIGAAALLANSVLQKPLNRLFSYRYHVTGTWAEPLVDNAGSSLLPLPPTKDERTEAQ